MRYSSTAVEIPKNNYQNQLQSHYLWGFFVSLPPYPTMLYVGRARRHYAAAALRPPKPLRAAATPPRFRESGGRRRATRPRPHFLCSSPSLRSGRLAPAGLVACGAAGPPPLCRAASPLRPANVSLASRVSSPAARPVGPP